MSEIGHNKPPNMIGTAVETTAAVSSFLAETPAIETEEQAKEAKVFLDRGRLCIKDTEDERLAATKPLNDQIKSINDHYRGPRELLQRVVDELRTRMDRYLAAEETRRQAIAAEAAARAKEAEENARRAEQAERAAMSEADAGVLGVDIAAAVSTADSAFADYQKAERAAAIAEKESHVKVSGGFTRALGLRSTEILHIVNWREAMEELGLTEHIHEAILKSARAYKKLKGKYPQGVEATIERKS